jgi:hypothetical protein
MAFPEVFVLFLYPIFEETLHCYARLHITVSFYSSAMRSDTLVTA